MTKKLILGVASVTPIILSGYVRSKTAFILYTLSFALAAVMKVFLWNYAAKNKENGKPIYLKVGKVCLRPLLYDFKSV